MPQPRRQARAVKTRDSLVEGAASVFADKGFDASINDIVEASGITKSSFYYHFANKMEIAAAVVTEGLVLDEPDPDLLPRVQAVVDTSISLAVLLPEVPVVRAASRLATQPDTPFYRKLWEGYIPYASGLLMEARERGELLPWVDPRAVARLWVGAWTGEDIMHRPNPNELPDAIANINRTIVTMCATAETQRVLNLSVAHGRALTAEHPKLLMARAVFQAEAG